MDVAEGLDWLHIFWYLGDMPRGTDATPEVRDPPTSGWQHAYVLRSPPEEVKEGKKPKRRLATIFCPYSFRSWQVTEECFELRRAREPKEYRGPHMAQHLQKKWAEYQRLGTAVDYDTAAMVLKRLDLPIPTIIVGADGAADATQRGGKPAADKLLKPVKRDGKRGKFLEWFLADEGRPRPIREAMVEFNVSRSNALSYLFMLNKDHGLGYTLVGDAASIIMPEGVESPFEGE